MTLCRVCWRVCVSHLAWLGLLPVATAIHALQPTPVGIAKRRRVWRNAPCRRGLRRSESCAFAGGCRRLYFFIGVSRLNTESRETPRRVFWFCVPCLRGLREGQQPGEHRAAEQLDDCKP